MRVTELWRYPIKSMLGEPLTETHVGPAGVEGDRRCAVVDARTGVSLSAKRYPELLTCRAWFNSGSVLVELPDGEVFAAPSSGAADALSELLGRGVAVRDLATVDTVRHEFPTELHTGTGDPFIWEPRLDAFFDRAPLHLITTGTLAEFADATPGSTFTRARFRPNFLVETAAAGFVENGWVGRDVRAGGATLRVLDHKPRCVMTTRPQGSLPRDPGVLDAVKGMNSGNAGVELATIDPGELRVGDALALL